MRVWLVGTIHEVTGHVTPSSLVAILERIAPEVIFLEMPSTAIWGHLDGTRSNLESRAVNLYREGRELALVPVDLPTPPAAFFRESRFFFESIEKVSREYCRLIDVNSRNTIEHGFAYLNSVESDMAWTEIYEAVQVAVQELDDERVNELHELWKATNEARENAMLQKIAEYSEAEPFKNGVLLVGTAHRRALLDKAQKHQVPGSPSFEGDLSKVIDAEDRG